MNDWLRALIRYLFGEFPTSDLASRCPCGHAASFHRDGGGCRHTHDGSVDCYGYCTCPRTFSDVVEDTAWETA